MTTTTRRNRSATAVFREWSARCRKLAERLLEIRHQPTLRRLFRATHDELLGETGQELDEPSVADAISQTLLHVRLAWAFADPRLHALRNQPGVFPPFESLLGRWIQVAIGPEACPTQVDAWLSEVEEFLRWTVCQAQQGTFSGLSVPPVEPDQGRTIEWEFDAFLGAHDPRGRARHGVYFTPRPIAGFIVREIDRLLRMEFALPGGLADSTTWSQLAKRANSVRFTPSCADLPFVKILDPAAGVGVFLSEVIDQLTSSWDATQPGTNAADRTAAWNEFVARQVLPRVSGTDLLLPACAVACIRLAEKLAQTGYRFESPARLGITLGDSLADPGARGNARGNSGPVTVLVGNPPFSALTTSGNAWIDALLRAKELNGRRVGGFYEVDGASLGERKVWLHDDYVKFLRFAQWNIEQAGHGLIGFVTNHGYLDNLTFRGVRQSLLASFARISVVDLHGNRKKREQSPSGESDENVFGIDQGVAIGLFRRPPEDGAPTVERADLWGSRSRKSLALRTATSSLDRRPLTPESPHYLFAMPAKWSLPAGEYSRGFPLDEVMPVNSTAAVTARDSFVVAFTEEELLDRMKVLADESWTDDELRRRFFFRTRSRRYPRGDTRGWKLDEARRRCRQASDLRPWVRRCLYRPFDWRWVFWADWMIDWPRHGVMRHMLAGDNLALVTRRQMIPNQPANYFFVADAIVVDGLIRSDNRGSESFFPLHLVADGTGASDRRQANFSSEFSDACSNLTSPDRPVLAEDLFHMIYAQFHSMNYRERYQAELCLGFPRVFVPRTARLFQSLADCGRRLVDAHLLRSAAGLEPHIELDSSLLELPARGWPRHSQDRIWLTDKNFVDRIPVETWDFCVGGYQVCRKWLRERAGRQLTADEFRRYGSLVTAISTTRSMMAAIDEEIAHAGGWPDAFSGRETQVQSAVPEPGQS